MEIRLVVKYCKEAAQWRISMTRSVFFFFLFFFPGKNFCCNNHTRSRAESIKTMWHLQSCSVHTRSALLRETRAGILQIEALHKYCIYLPWKVCFWEDRVGIHKPSEELLTHLCPTVISQAYYCITMRKEAILPCGIRWIVPFSIVGFL